MVERVAAHAHCPECGKSIGPRDEYCSKECKADHTDRLRAKRRQLLLLYFGGVGLFAFAMLLLFGRV